MKDIPITLVYSEPQPLWRQVSEKLTRLGYTRIQTFPWDRLLEGRIDRLLKLFIFQVNTGNGDGDKMKSAVERIREKRLMGIIQSPGEGPADDLLKYCDEFLYWPFSETELALRVDRLCEGIEVSQRPAGDAAILRAFDGMNMVGDSPPFLRVLKQLKKIAACDAPVLIEGETGTGKENAARAVHEMSDRRDGPFVPVNCGAIPDDLLENELFGHEKGAYTDAKSAQQGLIGQADGGALFFDEINAFTPKGQVVMLRFLQDRIFRPLGSDRCAEADVRIIAASNANLSAMVEQERFRQDLLYRLNIMSVELPPLRRRGGDIELLADFFIDRYRRQYDQPDKHLLPDTLTRMREYRWPGNIRELETRIHRESLLAEGPEIPLDLPAPSADDRRHNPFDRRQNLFLNESFNEAKKKVVDAFEKRYLSWVIREARGNVTLAAEKAGKERRALGKLLKKHGVDKEGVSGYERRATGAPTRRTAEPQNRAEN